MQSLKQLVTLPERQAANQLKDDRNWHQIINSGNDYVIAVKKNQPKLYKWIATQFEQQSPDSVADHIEQTRNRTMQRTVSVLKVLPGLDAAWVGVQRLIRVERTGIRGIEPVHETRKQKPYCLKSLAIRNSAQLICKPFNRAIFIHHPVLHQLLLSKVWMKPKIFEIQRFL